MLVNTHLGLPQYHRLLDKWNTQQRVPEFTIPRATPPRRAKTAADTIHPGQYRSDWDFPVSRHEIPKGMLTTSRSSPAFRFTRDDRRIQERDALGNRTKKGALKGTLNPPNRWTTDIGPGHYVAGEEQEKRAGRQVPSYSMPKSAKPTDKDAGCPGPGEYNLPSKFNDVDSQRWKGGQVRQETRRLKKCHWEGEFGNIFRSIHASARHGPHVSPPPDADSAAALAAAVMASRRDPSQAPVAPPPQLERHASTGGPGH